MPVGWEANATWKGIELRPTSPGLRRHLAGPVQLVTSVLEEFYNPAPNTWKDGTYEDRGELPRRVMHRPEGRQSDGSFPGGNRWFRTDLQAGRWRTTQWHISWPYRCEPGVPCPAPLALRTLKVVYQVTAHTPPPRSTAWRAAAADRPPDRQRVKGSRTHQARCTTAAHGCAATRRRFSPPRRVAKFVVGGTTPTCALQRRGPFGVDFSRGRPTAGGAGQRPQRTTVPTARGQSSTPGPSPSSGEVVQWGERGSTRSLGRGGPPRPGSRSPARCIAAPSRRGSGGASAVAAGGGADG